ncbi:hypothetical protein DRJ17_06725 [Candidatus Woesearchaeota archaeon]|nr:MAG: hypothetical protein DRJ17_06725 [Candidatus Woesearchaeota archaeon]
MSKSHVSVFEGQDKNIATYEFSEDGVSKHIERFAPNSGICTLPSSPQVYQVSATGLYPSGDPIDVVSAGMIVIKSSFSEDGQSVTFKIVFYDSNGALIGESNEVTVATTGRSDGTRYLGMTTIVDNQLIGASGIKIDVTQAPSSGNVSLYVAGV